MKERMGEFDELDILGLSRNENTIKKMLLFEFFMWGWE